MAEMDHDKLKKFDSSFVAAEAATGMPKSVLMAIASRESRYIIYLLLT